MIHVEIIIFITQEQELERGKPENAIEFSIENTQKH